MNESPLNDLWPVLGVAVFERTPEGTFFAATPVPAWLTRLVSDTTFPFLGHLLEEAVDFWRAGVDGSADYGPCAEVDDAGREFHYKVSAVVAGGREYLLFRLDPASDHLRDVLQQVRLRLLDARADARIDSALGATQAEVRRAGDELLELMRQFLATRPTQEQLDLLHALSRASATLVERIDTLVRSARP